MDMTTSTAPWGAIFDWDGVVTASEPLHERAWEVYAQRENLVLPDGYFKRSFGQRNEDIIPHIMGWAHDPTDVQRMADEKEACYRGLVRSEGLLPLPGVTRWLQELANAGIPRVIGTSTPRANIDCALEILNLEPPFDAIVASEDVSRGKPHPEVFVTCGERLGLLPGRGVVFEDAPVGIEAGLAAGFHVIAVTTSHPASELGRAHRIVERLDQLDLAELAARFTG